MEKWPSQERSAAPSVYGLYGGAGGSRTLVQTGKPYAFYTLIPDFGFRAPTRPGPPIDTLAPKSHPCIGACRDYFRFNLRRWILRFGTTSLERRLVQLPGSRIEPQSTMLRLGSESILVVAN